MTAVLLGEKLSPSMRSTPPPWYMPSTGETKEMDGARYANCVVPGTIAVT